MMSELEDVLKSIDELRSKVNGIVARKNPTDPQAVSASQRIDDLIDEYEELM